MTDRVAISNIAWTAEEDRDVARLLARMSVGAIEVAPGRLFPDPLNVSAEAARRVRAYWQDHGIKLAAMQSLLFGRADFDIFGDAAMRQEVSEYLKKIIELAGQLGCGPLVFGSPKNRRRKSLSMEQAYDQAATFFGPLATFANDCGCVLAMEPNATGYDCDFINRVSEAAELVARVASPGLRINLDAGVFELESDDLKQLERHASRVAHFHASRPYLMPLRQGSDTLASLYRIMTGSGYSGYVSIEMRKAEQGSNIENVELSVRFLQNLISSENEMRRA